MATSSMMAALSKRWGPHLRNRRRSMHLCMVRINFTSRRTRRRRRLGRRRLADGAIGLASLLWPLAWLHTSQAMQSGRVAGNTPACCKKKTVLWCHPHCAILLAGLSAVANQSQRRALMATSSMMAILSKRWGLHLRRRMHLCMVRARRIRRHHRLAGLLAGLSAVANQSQRRALMDASSMMAVLSKRWGLHLRRRMHPCMVRTRRIWRPAASLSGSIHRLCPRMPGRRLHSRTGALHAPSCLQLCTGMHRLRSRLAYIGVVHSCFATPVVLLRRTKKHSLYNRHVQGCVCCV